MIESRLPRGVVLRPGTIRAPLSTLTSTESANHSTETLCDLYPWMAYAWNGSGSVETHSALLENQLGYQYSPSLTCALSHHQRLVWRNPLSVVQLLLRYSSAWSQRWCYQWCYHQRFLQPNLNTNDDQCWLFSYQYPSNPNEFIRLSTQLFLCELLIHNKQGRIQTTAATARAVVRFSGVSICLSSDLSSKMKNQYFCYLHHFEQ